MAFALPIPVPDASPLRPARAFPIPDALARFVTPPVDTAFPTPVATAFPFVD